MYPEEICSPMREELTNAGFEELKTIEQVDNTFNNTNGTLLLFVNSVCGCAAGSARPGLIMSLSNAKKPDQITTVFAGQDKEATQRAREYMLPYPPSSPSIALFKNGELVHFIERHEIEGNLKQVISENLIEAFNKYC
jgi:putative YphP/YqiW family bacilliredoxin